MKPILLALALILPGILCAAEPATGDEAALKAHVAFLASDAMRGREAGSPEYDIAAEYVASRFLALGLKPAGDDGSYLQNVPLLASKLVDKGGITLVSKTGEKILVWSEEFLVGPSVRQEAIRADGELIFVGFGIVAPELKRDDYAGLDVRGKIVVALAGAPKYFPGEERAHYGRNKAMTAEAKGAIGLISVETPTSFKVRPLSRSAEGWDKETMVWRKPDGSGFVQGAPIFGTIGLKGAEKLFAGRPGGTKALMAAAETRPGKVKTGTLGLSARVTVNSALRQVESSNVAGLIEGSDPALKAEAVILSAHLDHLGIVKAVDGDSIANGAMDNAMGTGAMIEVAKRMVASNEKPMRSVLFLAVTAEEKGLVGADYYARHPTVGRANIVANVNLDMPVLTFDFQDVVAFGAERSALGPVVRDAARTMGIALTPDPVPDQGIFTRSDHYRFVQQGVPSVFIVTGPGGAGGKANEEFERLHYHKPSDEVTLPIDWRAGVKFIDLNLAIARTLANLPQRPAWNKGDFFGTLYEGHGAR